MSLSIVPQTEQPRRHASLDEYQAFMHARNSRAGTVGQFSKQYLRFVRLYPDLERWFAAPLPERVGRLYGDTEKQVSYRISNEARPYLSFLAVAGYAWFDWEWLIASPSIYIWGYLEGTRLWAACQDLTELAVRLGYSHQSAWRSIQWTMARLFMHTLRMDLAHLSETDIDALDEVICHFGERPDVAQYFGSPHQYQNAVHVYRTHLQIARRVLYHSGVIATPPRRNRPAPFQHPALPSRVEAVIERYLAVRRVNCRPKTVHDYDLILHAFANWLVRTYPEMVSWSQVTRDHLLAWALDLTTRISAETGRPLSARTKEGYLVTLATFLRDVALWQWEDVPSRPLLGPGDLPKRALRVPRYIPEEELARLMEAIRALDCPYQRTALLIARWSGARRDEIRRLEVNCLDSYADGTPRLRIPAGKTYQERLVPLHEEAAQAIRALRAYRAHEPARGFRDDLTGESLRRLFVHHGKIFSAEYLFVTPLREACAKAGLVTEDGKATVTAHRFRHTVGTQLAEKGARLHTIMKVLGHTSVSMSMVYAQVSDQEVRKDYQAVLGPGAVIAGPAASALRAGELQTSALAWLKTNFLKTELELGRCLRLPQEGPCECDLYLTCAKFVTTPEYAPRLRQRRKVELELIEDAIKRGWQREVERHQCVVKRLEQLLADLAEPLDGPEAPA
jgi:integrase